VSSWSKAASSAVFGETLRSPFSVSVILLKIVRRNWIPAELADYPTFAQLRAEVVKLINEDSTAEDSTAEDSTAEDSTAQ